MDLEGYEAVRDLGDGRYLCLMKLTFGRMRVLLYTEHAMAGEHW